MWHLRNTGDVFSVFSVFYSRDTYLQCQSSSSVMLSHKVQNNTGKISVNSTRFHGLFGFIVSIQVESAHSVKEYVMWEARKRIVNNHTEGD